MQKNKLFITIILVIFGSIMANDVNGESAKKREIKISGDGAKHSLGGSFSISIRYYNHTNHEITFREPAKTWEVNIVTFRNGEETEFPFGVITSVHGDGIRRKVIEEAIDITLKAGDSYEIKYDVGKRWPELFKPGNNTIAVRDYTDDSETITSNRLVIHVLYDNATFLNMLNILKNIDASLENKNAAIDWIKKLDPDFIYNSEANTDAEKAANEKNSKKAEAWWEGHKNDRRTARAINDLNGN